MGVSNSNEDRTQFRRRRAARVGLLKRRITVASILGFAALFGLAAQHVVRAAPAGTAAEADAASVSAGAAHEGFFDEHEDGFSFDTGGSPESALPQAPPVAQTSVS